MEGVIPNSKVVIIPPLEGDGMWRKELYLRPGEWIPWVTLTVVVATIILAIIVLVLHISEKVCRPLIFEPCTCANGYTERRRAREA